MPHLDGVSATVCIREIRPHVPIIAMTSNIRTDDIDMYFRYGKIKMLKMPKDTSNLQIGMNDVLPKPFTKEGMLRALEKHLAPFKKSPHFASQPMPHPGNFVTGNQTHAPLGLNMAPLSTASLKEEPSPGKSPATASSWQSPSQLTGTSPIGTAQGVYMQPMRDAGPFSMTPTNTQPPSQFPTQNNLMGGVRTAPQHRRVLSDMAGGPSLPEPAEKRPRMYPPQGNFGQ
jgi:osomolarity two-component system response regulator SKN7